MKKVETRKAPGYKWVVEDLCSACEAQCGAVGPAPDSHVAPVPPADAQLIQPQFEAAR
jgi:hypothetical protein